MRVVAMPRITLLIAAAVAVLMQSSSSLSLGRKVP